MFVAGVTAAVALLSEAGVNLSSADAFDAWALVDAVLFGVVARGLFRCSRVASVIGLALYILERIGMMMSMGGAGIPLMIVIGALFIGGVRGAFAYHRHLKADETLPPRPRHESNVRPSA